MKLILILNQKKHCQNNFYKRTPQQVKLTVIRHHQVLHTDYLLFQTAFNEVV